MTTLTNLALLAALAMPVLAQEPRWAASFAPDGPEALRGAIGRTVDGIGVYSANVCTGAAGLTLTPGQILIEAHKRSLILFDGQALDALLVGIEGRSPAVILLDVSEGLSLGGAVVINTDTINMRDSVRKKASFGLTALAAVAHWLHSKLTSKRVDPAKVRAFALPPEISFTRAQECWTGTLLGITGPPVSFEVRP